MERGAEIGTVPTQIGVAGGAGRLGWICKRYLVDRLRRSSAGVRGIRRGSLALFGSLRVL